MTRRLYYENSHLYSFSATVLQIINDNGRTAVILDKTAFFPEGGGQKSDIGLIGEAKVTDVQIINNEIYHFCENAQTLIIGAIFECRLDKDYRFARMQAHSGEHIVSGIAHNLFGIENVGFHMDGLLMTVDFSRYLKKDDLERIELEANQAVYADLPVKAWFPSKEELATLRYRSKLDGISETRIVSIQGIDCCACCAPHVASTGEIGVIKILTGVSHRGGMRITMICGEYARQDYAAKHLQLQEVADTLKVKQLECAQALNELLLKNAELKREIALQKTRLCQTLANGISYKKDPIILFVSGLQPDELRELAQICNDRSEKFFLVLSGDDENGYAYACASKTLNLKEYVKSWHADLGGKGGGRNELFGGRFENTRAGIAEYFNDIEVKML